MLGILVKCALQPYLNPLCNPYIHTSSSPTPWTKYSILLIEMFAVTLLHNVSVHRGIWMLIWVKPNRHKEHVRQFQLPGFICHTSDCLPVPVYTNVLLYDSVLLVTLSFLAGFCSDWAIPQLCSKRDFKKALACLCPCMDFQCCPFSLWSPLWQTLHIYQLQPQVLWVGCKVPSVGNWTAISFPSHPMCPSTHISSTLLFSAILTTESWQFQSSSEFTWILPSVFMAAWLSENRHVPTFVALFLLSIMHALNAYISAWNIVVWSPGLKLFPYFSPLYTPQH